jgi:hypothetical protein
MIYKIAWGGMLWNQKIMLNRLTVSKRDRLRSINGSNLNVPGGTFLTTPHWSGYEDMLEYSGSGRRRYLMNVLGAVFALIVLIEKNAADLLMRKGFKG